MEFNPDDIRTLMETVWSATLGMALSPEPACGGSSRSTVGMVHITGAWSGAALLDCSAQVARRAASVMFEVPEDRVTVSDMQDAVAELSNMVAGNLKALLPAGCAISLPSVVEGADYSARMPGTSLAARVELSCDGQRVSVTVVEKTGQGQFAGV